MIIVVNFEIKPPLMPHHKEIIPNVQQQFNIVCTNSFLSFFPFQNPIWIYLFELSTNPFGRDGVQLQEKQNF